MRITFHTSSDRMEALAKNETVTIVNAEAIEDSIFDTYRVTYEFPDHYTIDSICQFFFHAGIAYGFDIKYSSYDNSIPR
jgi:hypothetical protein